MPPTLKAKIEAEGRMRQLLESEGLPQPDAVEYGDACVRFLFHDAKACVVIDLDTEPEDSAARSGAHDQ